MPKNLGTYDDDYSVPRKKDVDSKLSLSGGTLTGPLELESNLKFTNATSGNILFSAGGAIRVTQGVLSLEPSNNIIEMSGDSSLNTIVRNVRTPSDDTDAANKAYVDGAAAGKADASTLSAHVGNKENPHGVTAAQAGALPITGGTLTGALNFGANGLVQSWQDASSYSNIAMQAQDGTKYTNIQVYVKDGEYGANLWSTEADGGKVLLHTGNIGNVAARQETGSYVGAASGVAAKTLTFSFVPKLVVVQAKNLVNGANDYGIFLNGASYAISNMTDLSAAWSGTSLTFSTVSSHGLNWNSNTYCYIALG